ICDPRSMLVNLTKAAVSRSCVREILANSSLGEFPLAPRLSHWRQMGILRLRIPEPAQNENLPRRVRQVLLRPDDMRDLHVEVIDHAGQVVQTCPVGALDNVVLLV